MDRGALERNSYHAVVRALFASGRLQSSPWVSVSQAQRPWLYQPLLLPASNICACTYYYCCCRRQSYCSQTCKKLWASASMSDWVGCAMGPCSRFTREGVAKAYNLHTRSLTGLLCDTGRSHPATSGAGRRGAAPSVRAVLEGMQELLLFTQRLLS